MTANVLAAIAQGTNPEGIDIDTNPGRSVPTDAGQRSHAILSAPHREDSYTTATFAHHTVFTHYNLGARIAQAELCHN